MKTIKRVSGDNELDGIFDGAKVKMLEAYGGGNKYFVCFMSHGFCLLADTKKGARDGSGYIYHVSAIDRYQIVTI